MTRDRHAVSREPSGPTTLSSLAHSGEVAAPRSRLGLIIGASAIIVGGAIGSSLALRMAPASASPRGRSSTEASASPRAGAQAAAIEPAAGLSPGSPPAAPGEAPTAASRAPAVPAATGAPTAAGPSAAAAAPTAAAPTAAASLAAMPLPPETRAALVAQIKDTLRRFVAWSHAHPGARCPDAAALGAALDPWGQPLQIVCSDQPADQVAGVLSYGPDGEPGTHDDVVSWALGADVTDLARGPRWSASRGMATPGGGRHGARPGPRTNPGAPPLGGAAPRATPNHPPRPPAAGAGSNDTDGDGIPDRR